MRRLLRALAFIASFSFTALGRADALRPTLLGEADYRVYPREEEGDAGFALARLRPGLVLEPAPWFRAVVAVEFVGEYPTILDAYMELRPTTWLDVHVGYAEPPLFTSRYEPIHTLPFPDRAPVVSTFGVERDLGIDVHLAPHKFPFEGWFRVGNGPGSPLGNDNPLPAAYALLDLVLGRAWSGAAKDARTFGLRVGAGGLLESTRDRDGIHGVTPLGFVYYRPTVVSGKRTVVTAHAIGYGGPLRITVEGAMAEESRSRDNDGNPDTARSELPALRSEGLTAELAWVLRGRAREVGVAPRSLTPESGALEGGALEIAVRYDEIRLGRAASGVSPGGLRGGAASMKWWPTPFLAVALAGYSMRYVLPPIEEPDELNSWGVVARTSFFWGLVR